MKVMVDLNVLLDVLQRREPHYRDSASVLGRVAEGSLQAVIPAHAVTTIHYVVRRADDAEAANQALDWILSRFEVIPQRRSTFLRARGLDIRDFEDAVVASTAEQSRCSRIVTRNIDDFRESPVAAITPRELEAELWPT